MALSHASPGTDLSATFGPLAEGSTALGFGGPVIKAFRDLAVRSGVGWGLDGESVYYLVPAQSAGSQAASARVSMFPIPR